MKSTHLLGVEKILDRPSCYLIWPSELTLLFHMEGELFLRTPLSRLCNVMQFDKLIGCEIVHFLESLTGGGIYGNFSAMGHVGA